MTTTLNKLTEIIKAYYESQVAKGKTKSLDDCKFPLVSIASLPAFLTEHGMDWHHFVAPEEGLNDLLRKLQGVSILYVKTAPYFYVDHVQVEQHNNETISSENLDEKILKSLYKQCLIDDGAETVYGKGEGWISLNTFAKYLKQKCSNFANIESRELVRALNGYFKKQAQNQSPAFDYFWLTEGNMYIRGHFDPKKELFDWANWGFAFNKETKKKESLFLQRIKDLKHMALKENWDYRGHKDGITILQSYLIHTFYKLKTDNLICYSQNGLYASFNTGLVNEHYDSIYALFSKNTQGKQPWKFMNFCVAGEGENNGKLISEHFNPMPQRAVYFKGTELLYDPSIEPKIAYNHIIVEHVERLPEELIRKAYKFADTEMPIKEDFVDNLYDYYQQLRDTIKNNSDLYNYIKDRIKGAIEMARMRAEWNYKTAIPMYYSRTNTVGLFLPLCICDGKTADVAIIMVRTSANNYQGNTIYPLDWAYRNARLVCRPDSDWLTTDLISAQSGDEE